MQRTSIASIRKYGLPLVGAGALAIAGFALSAGAAAASDFPSKTITIVVPYAPGGGVDTVGRLLALELQKQLKQTVLVDNRGGGGSGIGASYVARAQPDGYTLLVGDPALLTNSKLLPGFPVKTEVDLQPVSMLTASPLVLSVPPSSPAKSAADLVAQSKKSSGGLSFSSAGVGSTPHLAGELLKFMTKGNFTHVPYKGSGPAMADLVGGRIDFAFATQAASMAMVKGGKLRPLATTGTERQASEFPDLPTLSESLPRFRVVFWTGLFAPAGTPPDVVKKLDEAVRASWQSANVQAALRSAGDRAAYIPSDKAAAFLKAENEGFGNLIRDAKIQSE
jgi:tripartite-type tricarboxylate transporter receptor subunit TctC